MLAAPLMAFPLDLVSGEILSTQDGMADDKSVLDRVPVYPDASIVAHGYFKRHPLT